MPKILYRVVLWQLVCGIEFWKRTEILANRNDDSQKKGDRK